MPATLQKDSNGIFYAYSVIQGEKKRKDYPQCKSRTEFHDALRAEHNIPYGVSPGMALLDKTFDGEKWIDDPPRE